MSESRREPNIAPPDPPSPERRACLRGVGTLLGAHLALAAVARATSAPAPAPGLPPDADTFIEKGRQLLDDFWSDVTKRHPEWSRGGLDGFVPKSLRPFEPEVTDRYMRILNDAFWRSRNPNTGLIPYGVARRTFTRSSAAGMQAVWFIVYAMALMDWFPDDARILSDTRALADATIKYFNYVDPEGKPKGMWAYVDAATGTDKDGVYLAQSYGQVGKALLQLSQRTGEKRYGDWARQKLEYAWKSTPNPKLPLVGDRISNAQIELSDQKNVDTDSLYFIRYLYQIFDVTGDKQYRDWALATTDLWYRNAWNKEWRQFTRKLKVDGTPALDTIYSDGKYNLLYVLVEAYRVTKNDKYIQRFTRAWETYLALGTGGLVPERLTQGRMVSRDGPDPQQTIFLDILLAAHAATNDPHWLDEAQRFGGVVLKAGKGVWRMDGGHAGEVFLNVGLRLRNAKTS